MFLCYKCASSFENIDVFFHHLKYVENVKTFDSIQCRQYSCSQSFSSLHCFKRHLKNHHPLKNGCTQYPCSSPIFLEHHNLFKDNINFIDTISEISEDCSEDVSKKKINIDMNHIETEFNSLSLKLVLQLYGKHNISRKFASSIVSDFSIFISSAISILRKNNVFNSDNEVLDLLNDSLKTFDTEHKFVKHIENLGLFKPPIMFTIDNKVTEQHQTGCLKIDEIKSTGVIIPIEFQLKKLFELPNIYHIHLNNMELLSKSKDFSNFVQGNLWKMKTEMYPNRINIPFFLYYDDFAINNVIGPHCSSIAAFYYSLPTIPPYCLPFNNNIFTAMIYNSKFKEHGVDQCVYVLLDIIKKLEIEGITINIEGQAIQLFFILGLIVGDNLGLNSLLSFSSSFSANYYCRFCKSNKQICQSHCTEANFIMRNRQNYNEDLNANNFKLTGIHNNSIFNMLKTFHVTENFAVDVMHDIYEGVCHYSLCKILLFFIEDMNFFTLDLLNYRINTFDYGVIEIEKKPVPITLQDLKKNRLKMTASETKCFLNFLTIIVGDLVPENDKIWEYYLTLLRLVDLITSRVMNDSIIKLIIILTEKHNSMYTQLFHDTLKPKFHLLLHYGNIIKWSGPLRNLWVFRFESKHKDLKSYCNVISSRINLPFSISTKLCMNFAELLLSDPKGDLFFEQCIEEQLTKKEYFEEIKVQIKKPLANQVKCPTSISHKGTIYKRKYIICIILDDPSFYMIADIIITKSLDIYFVCNKINVNGFNSHYEAYEVNDTNNSYNIINIKEIYIPPLNIHKGFNNISYIRILS